MAQNSSLLKDRKRSPILSEKPETEKRLNNDPNAKIIFDEVLKIILGRYRREQPNRGSYTHGYVNYEPKYCFNFKGEGTISITAMDEYIRVRFKNKEGKVTKIIDDIKPSMLKGITEFLDTHGNEYLGFSNNNRINEIHTAVTRNDINRYFFDNEVIRSGGGRKTYTITIEDDCIRVHPTGANQRRVGYDKLSVVIDNFQAIDSKRIESSVRQILQDNNLGTTESECDLYGVAREYLKRKQQNTLPTFEEINHKFENAVEEAKRRSREERKARLENASRKPTSSTSTITVFNRNPDVVAEVLERADGVCEACGNNAPFKRTKDGTPFLEVHHKIRLADNGDDTVKNAIALCPNCHRKQHYGITK